MAPQYKKGETVRYKPVGGLHFFLSDGVAGLINILYTNVGPDSNTPETVGTITDVLTEPGRQADRNVNASEEDPRYEVSRSPCETSSTC
jgi:hypothetical protein